jgi:hypothetical protein
MKGTQMIGNYKQYKTIGEGAFAKVRSKSSISNNLIIFFLNNNINLLSFNSFPKISSSSKKKLSNLFSEIK